MVEGHFQMSHKFNLRNPICGQLSLRLLDCHCQDRECNTVTVTHPDNRLKVESSWNVIAHGDAREGKWRGNWRMEWVASTLHTTSERGVSSITTADAHTSAASSRLNWRPRRFKDSSVSPKDEIWFLCVCHHISNAVYRFAARRRILKEQIMPTR